MSDDFFPSGVCVECGNHIPFGYVQNCPSSSYGQCTSQIPAAIHAYILALLKERKNA